MSRYHHRSEHRRGWERTRKRAISAAGRRCTRCGLPGRLEVHHPTQLSQGGTHEQRLSVLCRVCHLKQHHKPDPARLAWVRFLIEEFAAC